MTTITLKETDEFLVKVEGHATGSQQVCSAVSALVYTLAGYLDNEGIELTEFRINEEEPSAIVRFPKTPKSEVAFDMVSIGFSMMESSYGDFLRINYKSGGEI